MWFMNKILNPIMRLILRSPLHGMLGSDLLLITYRGRKSGREYTLPVQHVQDGRTVYILPGQAQRKTWWRNLRGGTPVRLLQGGQLRTGRAEILEGSAEIPAIVHALGLYLKHFPASARLYEVRVEQDGSPNPDDLNRAAASCVVVRVDLVE